jgi:hypothetical protein
LSNTLKKVNVVFAIVLAELAAPIEAKIPRLKAWIEVESGTSRPKKIK